MCTVNISYIVNGTEEWRSKGGFMLSEVFDRRKRGGVSKRDMYIFYG